MSKSSGSFILSWPVILALIFGYNFLFDDDEKDEKTISVEEEAPIVSEETKQELKESVTEAITAAKEALLEAKESFQKEDDVDDTAHNQQEEKEEVVEKEKEVQTLKPLKEEDKGLEMKKL